MLNCPSPTEIENGTIVGGFAHEQVFALADKVVDAVSGAITKLSLWVVVMVVTRHAVTMKEFAKGMPESAVILTAGCAKYRYNELDLGDIGGIPAYLMQVNVMTRTHWL